MTLMDGSEFLRNQRNHLQSVTDREKSAKELGGRDRRALSRLDWISLGLLIAALILAPLLAGSFSTPSPQELGPPDGPFGWLRALGTPLVVLLIVGALSVALWREWQRPVAIGAAPGLAGSGLLLAAWGAMSLVRTPALYLGLNALMVLLAALVVGGLISRLCRDRQGAAALLLTVVVAGTLVGGIGVNEYLIKWREGAPNYRAMAGFINPDFTAGYLLLTLPITVAVFVALGNRKSERINDLALGLALVLQAACLLLTGSRTGIAVLAFALLVWVALCVWSGAIRGRGKRIGLALTLCALGGLLASAPLRSRLAAPPPSHSNGKAQSAAPTGGATALTTQSQSGQFRRYTWNGTSAMIKANPLLGTGIGSFSVAYNRYAETGFTAHAHNSLLQWTSETGLPGALFLLAVFAAATAFAVNVLRLRRALASEKAEEPAFDAPKEQSAVLHLFLEPSLLLTGLLAALLASAGKTFIDSDWYIVPTALTLAATLGLLVGLARAAAPLATQTPRPLSRELLIGCALVALLLLWRAGTTFNARLNEVGGAQAMQSGRAQLAQDAYRAAIAADPYDLEARLQLALLYGMVMHDKESEEAAMLGALRVAPIARTYYRLGQFYTSNGQLDQAIAAYRHALTQEPKNLQTLRRLGEVLEQTGHYEEAAAAYRAITDLQNTPYGTVRAVADEIIETDFAYGHAGLARNAMHRGQWSEAAAQYAAAIDVMRLYWQRRNWLMYQSIAAASPQKPRELAAFYHEILTGRLEALGKEHADAQQIAETTEELKQVDQQTEEDEQNRAAAQAGGGQ